MVQIFVKVDGGKTSAMEMEMSDKVHDIVKKIPISDLDVYVTSEGRVLRGCEELKRSGVRDGSTVHVMSRLRGGGKHKDKKKVEKKQELFLVAFKNGCRLPSVLVEELEKLAKSEVTTRRAAMKSQAAEDVTKNEEEAEKFQRKAKEEQSEKVREQSTDVQDATSGLDEARNCRGSTGLARGRRKSRQTDETEEKENMEAREVSVAREQTKHSRARG